MKEIINLCIRSITHSPGHGFRCLCGNNNYLRCWIEGYSKLLLLQFQVHTICSFYFYDAFPHSIFSGRNKVQNKFFTAISSTSKLELDFTRVGKVLNLVSVCSYLVINFFPFKYLNIVDLFYLKVLRSLQSYATLKFNITWKLKWCFKR